MIQHKIIDGPSLFDLIISLCKGNNSKRLAVQFTINNKDKFDNKVTPIKEVTYIELQINSLERNAIASTYNFIGVIVRPTTNLQVSGEFNTKIRKGFIMNKLNKVI